MPLMKKMTRYSLSGCGIIGLSALALPVSADVTTPQVSSQEELPSVLTPMLSDDTITPDESETVNPVRPLEDETERTATVTLPDTQVEDTTLSDTHVEDVTEAPFHDTVTLSDTQVDDATLSDTQVDDATEAPLQRFRPLVAVTSHDGFGHSFVTRRLDTLTDLSIRHLASPLPVSRQGFTVQSLASRTLSQSLTSIANSASTNDDPPTLRTGSGTAFVIRQRPTRPTIHKDALPPLATVDHDTVTLEISMDSSLRPVVSEALHEWQVALHKQGIRLNVVEKPKTARLVFLDADNVTTKAARTVESHNTDDDRLFEMERLAGLTTFTDNIRIADLDANDKLNRSGTFTTDALAQTRSVIQLNTESVDDHQDQVNVIKHELGHVFGLVHDNQDPLMTTYFSDAIFTGLITDHTAALAAQNLRENKWCACALCLGQLSRVQYV